MPPPPCPHPDSPPPPARKPPRGGAPPPPCPRLDICVVEPAVHAERQHVVTVPAALISGREQTTSDVGARAPQVSEALGRKRLIMIRHEYRGKAMRSR